MDQDKSKALVRMEVCHLTSVHPRYDTRIVIKECRSLSEAGYIMSLVVADGNGNELRDGITIFDVGCGSGRIDRMYKVAQRVFQKAVEIDADIYHLHDPELLPVGLQLKKRGKRVIFDAHEDVPKQILGKHYLGTFARHVVSGIYAAFERFSCSRLDAIVAATPTIRDKFLALNSRTVDVNNFPLLSEFASHNDTDWSSKKRQVCYVGGIAGIRGIREIVRAMEFTTSGARLQLGGRFSEQNVESEVKAYPGWKNVDELGFLDRRGVSSVLADSVAGIVTLHPVTNYLDALPVKMFEYMCAGIPVIASNFPLWREIVEGNNCGICVDPRRPEEIAIAIDRLVADSEGAETMGKNGARAVAMRYNWAIEERKLIALYSDVLESA